MSFTLRTYCTGGDLFGTGAAAAGWRVVDGYEIDPAKAAVAQLNGHDVRVADVTRMDFDCLSPVWHEHTSPSCKTASQANTAGGETPDDLAVADAMCRAIHAHAARGGRSWSLENVWGYRSYESFARILAALSAAGFTYTFEHINMANFGVPQTRKRLILWAVRKGWRERVPGIRPSHGKRGGILLSPWVGWLPAIADLVADLPDTQPAPWQELRLPEELRHSTLVEKQGARNGNLVLRAGHEPSWTVRASDRQEEAAIAYLLSPAMSGEKVVLRTDDQPSVTVVADEEGRLPFRALLCGGGNTNVYNPTSKARESDEPAFTVRDGRNGSPDRALLLGDRVGVWKRLTLQCLARFQTVPDSYKGLTAEINGNGVPCLFAQRLMEVLR